MSSRSNKTQAVFQSHRSRFFLVRCLVIFAFSILAGRLVYVQGFLRVELENKADRQCPSRPDAQNIRHRILDRNQVLLAETVQVASCFVDPSLIKSQRAVAKNLSQALRINEPILLSRIKKVKSSFLWVKRNVPSPVVERIKKQDMSGVGFKFEHRRHYPEGMVAGHLLGLVGYEGNGLSGLEQSLERVLEVGSSNEGQQHSSLPSGNVQLTIDASIQKIVERELEWGAKKTGSKKGMAIVQNPWTGEIVAMASWPPVSMDPDQPPAPAEMRVPTLVDVFEPGSTFKIVTAAAAIEENLIRENERFDGEKGAWKVHDITIHDHEPLQRMTFDEIIIHSSNIGTAKIAERIGSDRLYKYAQLFGFGVFPGSGLMEAKGLLKPPSKWSGVSKYVVSFGQEVGVTAIQLVNAYSVIANGGVLMEPRLIKAVVGDDGAVLWQNSPAEVRRVVSAETAKRLTEMLVKVVEKGTGVNAQIQWDLSTKVAGKTGTAQKYDKATHRYHETQTLVSFCGFFPADHPQFTMLVLLDEPKGRGWGGLDAAPIFRRIAEQLSPKLVAMKL